MSEAKDLFTNDSIKKEILDISNFRFFFFIKYISLYNIFNKFLLKIVEFLY